jgi:hypothetical protein
MPSSNGVFYISDKELLTIRLFLVSTLVEQETKGAQNAPFQYSQTAIPASKASIAMDE